MCLHSGYAKLVRNIEKLPYIEQYQFCCQPPAFSYMVIHLCLELKFILAHHKYDQEYEYIYEINGDYMEV